MRNIIIKILEIVLMLSSVGLIFIAFIFFYYVGGESLDASDPENVAEGTMYTTSMVSLIAFQLGVFSILYLLNLEKDKQKTPE